VTETIGRQSAASASQCFRRTRRPTSSAGIQANAQQTYRRALDKADPSRRDQRVLRESEPGLLRLPRAPRAQPQGEGCSGTSHARAQRHSLAGNVQTARPDASVVRLVTSYSACECAA
jgi:hypothetical protein